VVGADNVGKQDTDPDANPIFRNLK